MIATPWIGALALLAPLTPAAEGEVRLIVERPQVELGQPFELRVEAVHDAGTLLRLGELPYDLDRGWLLFDAGRPVAEERADGSGLVSTVRFRLAAIQQTPIETEEGWTWSATRELPAPELFLVRGENSEPLACEPATILALSVLEVGEDVPRAFPDPLDAASDLSLRGRWERAGLVVALAAAILGWAWFVLLRQRGADREEATEQPLAERRRDVDAAVRAGAPARELVFELTALVRDAVDAHAAEADGVAARARRGLTDAEWLASDGPRALDEGTRDAVADFLAGAARAKYSGHEPTGWAVEELARAALDLVDAVDAASADRRRVGRGGAA